MENKIKFTKFIPLDDVQFVKQVPVHPRERFKKAIAARLKNKKITSAPTPLKQEVAALEKNLKQKAAKLEDKLRIIKVVPSHPRGRLQRKIIFIKQVPTHPQDRLQKRVKELEDTFKLLNKFLHTLEIDLNVQFML